MERADAGLGYLLQYEHVAWYEDGAVRILDRRVYPLRTEYVVCKTHGEVARAIADMVTQSGGPFLAAAMGMALAAWETRALPEGAVMERLAEAAYTLAHARPTTSARMAAVTDRALAAARAGLAAGHTGAALAEDLRADAVGQMEEKYRRYDAVGALLADRVPPGGTVLTQCFGETVVGTLLRALRARGNAAKFICAETRPYFQGARLTASVVRDMGFDVTVITDNMPAYVMEKKSVDLFTSAADVITLDGHIVNKIGTFQIALAARYRGIPYYVTGMPDAAHPDMGTVVIEERDPAAVLEAMGTPTVMPGVGGYYPAFDVTPPEFCRGVVTDRGIFSPFELQRYFAR